MSEEELRRVMERIDTDEAFRDMLGEDPEAALQGFDISPVEAVALGAGDEEALRRLAGVDTVGFDKNTAGPCGGYGGGLLTKRLCLVTAVGCNTGPACGVQTAVGCLATHACQK